MGTVKFGIYPLEKPLGPLDVLISDDKRLLLFSIADRQNAEQLHRRGPATFSYIGRRLVFTLWLKRQSNADRIGCCAWHVVGSWVREEKHRVSHARSRTRTHAHTHARTPARAEKYSIMQAMHHSFPSEMSFSIRVSEMDANVDEPRGSWRHLKKYSEVPARIMFIHRRGVGSRSQSASDNKNVGRSKRLFDLTGIFYVSPPRTTGISRIFQFKEWSPGYLSFPPFPSTKTTPGTGNWNILLVELFCFDRCYFRTKLKACCAKEQLGFVHGLSQVRGLWMAVGRLINAILWRLRPAGRLP
jgi:hypothetical protein